MSNLNYRTPLSGIVSLLVLRFQLLETHALDLVHESADVILGRLKDGHTCQQIAQGLWDSLLASARVFFGELYAGWSKEDLIEKLITPQDVPNWENDFVKSYLDAGIHKEPPTGEFLMNPDGEIYWVTDDLQNETLDAPVNNVYWSKLKFRTQLEGATGVTGTIQSRDYDMEHPEPPVHPTDREMKKPIRDNLNGELMMNPSGQIFQVIDSSKNEELQHDVPDDYWQLWFPMPQELPENVQM